MVGMEQVGIKENIVIALRYSKKATNKSCININYSPQSKEVDLYKIQYIIYLKFETHVCILS